MPKCKIRGCKKFTRYKNTKEIYCLMHLARIKRHGYPELKKDAYQSLEKLPHSLVDDFIRKSCQKMIDKEIVKELKKMGFQGATQWTVKYRRRKLGIKKYLYGEVKKHKAWIRQQAIKKYGNACELCGYNIHVETHHITPKHQGGIHTIDNLIVLCPNCHTLVTNKKLTLSNRKDITKLSRKVKKLLKLTYPYLG
ncbi:MAG: HNH endonuclease [Candidatus Nealsonbacteria bacterium]|nr:MAG: HNH endonuclease [Candidatus Nealsonbacteria bacterium]